MKRALDPCSTVWAVFNPCNRLYKNPVILSFFKIAGFSGRRFNCIPSYWLCILLHGLSQVFLHLCDLIIKKQKHGRGKKGSPRGHSLHPQAALLLSPIVLPLRHNVWDAILHFSAVLYRLFLFNQEQSPGESNQEIIRTFKQTKLASRRA